MLVQSAGADVNARDEHGNSPLHFAALRGNVPAVEALLARGADASATNAPGATALHYGTGDERIVGLLLAHGADPNAQSKSGMTPLLGAVQRGNSHRVVRRLVDAGADLQAARGRDGNTVLTQAIFGGDRRTVAFLLARGAKPSPAATKDGASSLEMAALVGDLELVRTLLARGADVNTPSPFMGHSLNAAFYAGHPQVAAFVIEHGADLHMKSVFGHGTPPMVWSAYNEEGDTTLARLLLSHGVKLDTASDAGDTALAFALRRGADTPLVRYLRSAGAREHAGAARAKSIPAHDVPTDPAARTARVRERTQRSLDLLARGSRAFLENSFVRNEAKCTSCHHQTLPAVAFGLARERGLRVDEHELGRTLHAHMAMWSRRAESARQMREPLPDAPISMGYGFDGLAALRYAPDEVTDALVHYLIAAQLDDGSWQFFDQRPPMEGGRTVAVAWGVRAIQLYPPPGEKPAASAAVQRAREWMEAQEPPTPEERVFQLLGLAWAGATETQLAPRITRLLGEQRADGGWASLRTRDSDAWATGTALVALHRAGVAVTDEPYRRGVDYLLRTQFDDGSWWVRSRSWPFQPHFDGRFPHGKDQWISAGGTAWAAIALLLTLEPQASTGVFPDGQSLIAKFRATEHPVAKTEETAAPAAAIAVNAAAGSISFARQIWPVLDRSCGGCHAREKPKGDFSLASRELFVKGGQSGEPAIVPGRSAESRLLAYVADKVEDLEMPPLHRREKYPALTAEEISLLRDWIDAGAEWGSIENNRGDR